jgi:hypothetical protein
MKELQLPDQSPCSIAGLQFLNNIIWAFDVNSRESITIDGALKIHLDGIGPWPKQTGFLCLPLGHGPNVKQFFLCVDYAKRQPGITCSHPSA